MMANILAQGAPSPDLMTKKTVPGPWHAMSASDGSRAAIHIQPLQPLAAACAYPGIKQHLKLCRELAASAALAALLRKVSKLPLHCHPARTHLPSSLFPLLSRGEV